MKISDFYSSVGQSLGCYLNLCSLNCNSKTPNRGVRASTGKDSSELRGSIFPVSSGSSYISTFQFSGSHFFPIDARGVTAHTMWSWDFNLHYNSATDRLTLWIRFSEISELLLWELRFSFRARTEMFKSSWGTLNSCFPSYTLSSGVRVASQSHYTH